MIQAVFFDLNGVLINSEYLSVRFAREFGVAETEFIAALKDIMAIVRKPQAPTLYSLWHPYFSKWGITLSEEAFLQFWFSGERVEAEALKYTEELKAEGIKVFILSNNFRERTEFYRREFPQIFTAVEASYFSWETGFVKPDPAALALVLREQTLKPERVVYFDDSQDNIAMGQSLSVDAQLWPGLAKAKEYVAARSSGS